jgi:hypothetical protein
MKSGSRTSCTAVTLLVLVLIGASAQATTPLQLLLELDDFPHATQIEFSERDVLDYDVGLGAIQKIGGAWKFKRSERFNGNLTGYTWQIVDGFTSLEVMDALLTQVEALETAELMFSCDGRACGNGVQWANRVFHQPVLYGQESLQRYRVYAIGEAPRNLLLVYAAARTADRQYLHAELLQLAD